MIAISLLAVICLTGCLNNEDLALALAQEATGELERSIESTKKCQEIVSDYKGLVARYSAMNDSLVVMVERQNEMIGKLVADLNDDVQANRLQALSVENTALKAEREAHSRVADAYKWRADKLMDFVTENADAVLLEQLQQYLQTEAQAFVANQEELR